jgi:hypothetical protein
LVKVSDGSVVSGVTTNPREGTKILRILSILRIVAVTTNPREGTGKSALNELEMSSG